MSLCLSASLLAVVTQDTQEEMMDGEQKNQKQEDRGQGVGFS